MSLKKPLVKQRVIKSSSIEEDLPAGDDKLTKDNHLLASLQRKRVSFEFERPAVEDSDSDEENSLGRQNRPDKRGSFDSLFRSSDVVETKTEIVERSRGKTEVQPPRAIPRRHASSIQQSSEDDRHRDPPASRTVQPNKPVPHLRSPRQQPDSKEARTVPKPRPRLSPRENSPRLGTLGDSGADVIDGPKERPMVLPRKQYKDQTEKSGPQIPVIKTSFYDDKTASYKEDKQGRGNIQKGRNIVDRTSAVPTHELSLSESSDDEEESGSSGLSDLQRGRRLARDDVAGESSGRQPKRSLRGHITSSGISREGKLVNDSHVNDREEVRTNQTRASSPTKTDFKYVRTPERSGSAKLTKEHAYREDTDYEAEHSKRKLKSELGNFDSDRVHEKGRVRQKMLEKDFDAEASPGRRNGAGGLSRTADRNLWSEDSKERVRSGRDAAPVQRSSSFDAKLNSAQRKSAGSEGERGVSSRHSPLSQRPASAKRKSYRTLERDVTVSFEEHVPQQDNVVEVDDLQVEQRKISNRANVQGSMKPMAGSTPIRGGPLRASRGIDEMTRSSQLRELMTQRSNDSSSSPTRSLRQKRASSMTDLRGYSPRSTVNYESDDDASRQISLDTTTIRQAVFDNWMLKKNESLKKELAKKTTGKKRQEEKEKEERREKTTAAKRAFESWNEKKAGVFKEQRFKLKEGKEKEEDKSLQKHIKQRDANKFFDSWKVRKDEELKEMHRKKKQEEAKKKSKKREDKQEKTSSASKVYDNWKNKKDETIKQELKEKTAKERREAQKKEDEEYEKSLERADKLEAWKQTKGTPRKGPPPPTLTQRSWCPGGRNSGNCIPNEVDPVIQSPTPNRSRKLSGSERFQSGKYDF